MGHPTDENGNIIIVTKASGEKEPFKTDKLRSSPERSGAGSDITDEIVAEILGWAFDGVTTKEIYSRAFALLRRRKTGPAMRYKLKQAIMELGPTGYPFEHFVGMIFRKQGYQVETGQIIMGHCVSHEMDVIATGSGHQILVECKYGQDQGKHVGVQVPLYVRSRVDDIIRKRREMPEYEGISFQGWVFTNTRFSTDSIDYAKCSGLQLVGWDYPAGKGLKDLIEQYDVFPITLLGQLSKNNIQTLLDQGIVTCALLLKNKELINTFELSKKNYSALMQELEVICSV